MTEYDAWVKLSHEQARASAPDTQIWLGASAGTGKTQVLSARVLRLLLDHNPPESILCLTFTKGGATEMARRVNDRLAKWVRASQGDLHRDLVALGAPRTPEDIAFARTLLARVLDARGAGLQIQTIHSFCQTILAGFPAEAQLAPGFRALDERAARKLQDGVLADLVSVATTNRDVAFLDGLKRLVLDIGDHATKTYLRQCTQYGVALDALGNGLEPCVRVGLGLPLEDIEPKIVEACADAKIDRAGLEEIRAQNQQWGQKRGLDKIERITRWLDSSPESRAALLDDLAQVWLKKDGDLQSMSKSWAPQTETYVALCHAQHNYFARSLELRKAQALADSFVNALSIGQRYARAYTEAKAARGAVDFNDLIARTAALLAQPGMGDWVRFKLDTHIDHILVDEAQDTNDRQWEIVRALAEEFYAGMGAKGDRLRTIFTVGDTKQAIFGFQGSDPQSMARARTWFAAQCEAADQPLLDLALQGSFRSSPPILELVDAVIETLTPEAMGVTGETGAHISQQGSHGQVLLLPPIRSNKSDADDQDAVTEEEDGTSDPASEGEAKPELARSVARAVARHVVTALTEGLPIENRKGGARHKSVRAKPKDVMILLRKRSNLARLIVAQLTEAGVPVAGVDRLRLNTPLVVRDILAALHFALQPNDDLNLACLLVSPLVGWSQERLQAAALARGRLSLWRYLRATETEAELLPLRTIMRLGDRLQPAQCIEALLSGELGGRERCLARFGPAARDPLDELLNAAFIYERDNVPTLQGFVQWFENDTDDIKRDAETEENAVRVLTVHGAKGLQAPIVILADATVDPNKKQDDVLPWNLLGATVPVPRPKKQRQVAAFAAEVEAARRRAMEEHWRLLYVALTRAEERLVVMGGLDGADATPDSWYAAVQRAMVALGCTPCANGAYFYGKDTPRDFEEAISVHSSSSAHVSPDWLHLAAPAESRPARPLSPSRITVDSGATPPESPALVAAAHRGRRLHNLFERLPEVAPDARRAIADAWLATAEAMLDPLERSELIDCALTVIEDPQFAYIFSVAALAEAPLAGVVDGVVIAGTVDRLIISPDEVIVVDFKTNQRVPQTDAAIPEAHLRQMAAYTAVLSQLFTNRPVRAVLLYTAKPRVFALEPDMLAPYKPSYQLEQQVFAAQA